MIAKLENAVIVVVVMDVVVAQKTAAKIDDIYLSNGRRLKLLYNELKKIS